MRLTVRTLLAWIDGLLGPEDQAALGEKVQSSGVAPALVQRVRDVIGRRTLSAPPAAGRGLADDPNTAAEFLDNTLAADRLEAFERVCVESDIHLADVAACHQLLAELAREPAAIESVAAARRRQLLDMAMRRLDPIEAVAVAVSESGRGSARVGDGKPLSATRPQGRRAPVAAWASAAAALALLGVLGGFFVWSLMRGPKQPVKPQEITAAPVDVPRKAAEVTPAAPPQAAMVEPQAADRDAAELIASATAQPVQEAPVPTAPQPTAPRLDAPVQNAEPPAPAASAPNVAAMQATQPENPAVTPGVAGPGLVAEAAPEQPTATVPSPAAAAPAAAAPVAQRVPSGDALAIVAGPPAAVSPPAVAPDGPPAAAAARDDVTTPAAARAGGPLLHRGEADGATTWLLLPVDAPLSDREDLIAPPWCHPELAVEGATIRLEPGSRAVLTRDADGTPRLELVFGRAVVSGEAADARIGVLAGGLNGVISGVMRQPAGIEVLLDRGPGVESTPSRRAVVHAAAAGTVWRQVAAAGGALPLVGLPPEVLLAPRAALAWDEGDPSAAAVVPPADEPAWMRFPAGGDRLQQSAARALADTLAGQPEAGIDGPLRRLAADRRAENRMIAAATLALLGEYREVVGLLTAEPPLALTETQWATLEQLAVPLALARGENSAAALAEAFRMAGPEGKGDTLMACARGFSDDDLGAGGAALLVESLGDGSLAVRRYAIRRLLEIVPPDARHRSLYRADHPDTLRADGIAWWKTQLEQGRIRRGGVPPATVPAVPRERDDE
jgi:hypothetical protein